MRTPVDKGKERTFLCDLTEADAPYTTQQRIDTQTATVQVVFI